MARPMPREAPVTMATRLRRGREEELSGAVAIGGLSKMDECKTGVSKIIPFR